MKSHSPAKVKELIIMVMETKYSDKLIIHKYSEERLSPKKSRPSKIEQLFIK